MKRKTNVKKYKSKHQTKTKTVKKTVKKNSIKKTVKTKQKNPRVISQKSIIITTSPIIDSGISKISWRNIYDICENAIV